MNIIVSPQAANVISKIAQYIKKEFGQSRALKFHKEILKSFKTIASNPNLGQKIPLLEDEPIDYRSFLVNRINKVIYYVDAENVNIVYVWDTRQDPEKIIEIVRV